MQPQPQMLNSLKIYSYSRFEPHKEKKNTHKSKTLESIYKLSPVVQLSTRTTMGCLENQKKIIITFCVDTRNRGIVYEILSQRKWLTDFIYPEYAKIRWKPTSVGIKFNHFQLINHYSHHSEMTTKHKLYNNLIQYQGSFDIQKYLPKTYIILNHDDLQRFLLNYKNECYFIKPTSLNCGQGIRIFNNSQTLKQLACFYKEFVLQEAIQNPYLIDERKFDFRVWVLLDQNRRLYWCKQGYLRLSSEKFDNSNISDLYIHLTNWAIQKHHYNFGRKESGNQLSFTHFQLIEKRFYSHIIPRFKQLINYCFEACYKKIDPQQWKGSYELFGFDFMIDTSLQVYLIEVNTNPCLEKSSQLLKQLIPRMLNNMFQIVLDQQFQKSSLNSYPLDGFSSDDNLWELVNQF